MVNKTLQRILIGVVLFFLTLNAFLIRYYNFYKPQASRSVDEVVYYRLALQMKDNFFDYSAVDIYPDLETSKVFVPEYMTRPLFKHPPLFAALIAAILKVFGDDPMLSGSIAAFFGALLIPLTYFLARILFSRIVGFIAALLVFVDPIGTLCSQKVWPDSLLAFLMLFALFCYLKGFKNNSKVYYSLGGMACGLSLWVKYPGILAWGSILVYAFMFRKELFQEASFRLSLIFPFILLIPWILWNVAVYGRSFFVEHFAIHGFHLSGKNHQELIILFVGCILLYFTSRILKKYLKTATKIRLRRYWSSVYLRSVIFVGLLVLLRESIADGLTLFLLPSVSNGRNFFLDANRFFYLGRLLKYSPFYLFSFYFMIFYKKERDPKALLLIIFLVLNFCFFSFWGSLQMRYILATIPLLLILGVQSWLSLFSKAYKAEKFFIRIFAQAALLMIMILGFIKFNLFNHYIGFMNAGVIYF